MAVRRGASASRVGGAARAIWILSPELRQFLDSADSREIAKPLGRFLSVAGLHVLRNASDRQIIRGGRFRGPAGARGGRGKLTDRPPNPTRVTSRSGELRRSLSSPRGVDATGLPRALSVGSDLVYSGVHEYGLRVGRRRYPVRAFLAPALEAEARTFPGLLEDELRQHFRLT